MSIDMVTEVTQLFPYLGYVPVFTENYELTVGGAILAYKEEVS